MKRLSPTRRLYIKVIELKEQMERLVAHDGTPEAIVKLSRVERRYWPLEAELLRRIILERFGRRYGSVCGAMHRYFKVPNLSSLLASRFNEAREFILTFPLPPAPLPRLNKPSLPGAESDPDIQHDR